MWASEYDRSIKKRFLADKTTNLFARHGFVNDSLELRMWGWPCGSPIDTMFVYKHNETTQWNGFHTDIKRFR
jgi:hypothetical protein